MVGLGTAASQQGPGFNAHRCHQGWRCCVGGRSARVNVSLLKNGLGFLDSTEWKVCVNPTNEYKTFMKWLLLTTTSHYVKMKTNERDCVCVCVGWGEHNVQVIYKSSKYRLTRGLKNKNRHKIDHYSFFTLTNSDVLEKYFWLASATFFSAACGFTISKP